MSGWFSDLLPTTALAAALSLDAFFAGMGYGASGVCLTRTAALVAAGCCAGVLAAGMLLGGWMEPLFSAQAARWAGAAALALLGCGKIGGGALKKRIRRADAGQLCFRLFDFRCILRVYADPAKADADSSRSISSREGLALGAALSLDGAAAGVGAGLTGGNCSLAALSVFVMTAALLAGGAGLGRRLRQAGKGDMDWLGGGLLMALAVAKLIG